VRPYAAHAIASTPTCAPPWASARSSPASASAGAIGVTPRARQRRSAASSRSRTMPPSAHKLHAIDCAGNPRARR
jgi:hypothetical protein